MSSDARDRRDKDGLPGDKPADETELSARLKNLDSRLSDIRHGDPSKVEEVRAEKERAERASGMARGFRLSSELVAGVLVGAGIGWLLDRLLSTSPFGFIVFLLLGFCAGILNLMRAAGVMKGGMPDSTRRD